MGIRGTRSPYDPPTKKKMSEAELAQKFVDYLKEDYELFFEMYDVDIIGRDRDKKFTIGVEVKTSLNFKVIEQAYYNLNHRVNYSYIAVPETKDISFAFTICKMIGIGVLVCHDGRYVYQKIPAKLNRHNRISRLNFREVYKQAIPGTKCGQTGIDSDFNITVKNIERYVVANPGCTIKDVVNNIDYHYSSLSSAKSSIYNRIKSGIIKSIRMEGRQLYFVKEQVLTKK